MSRPGSNERLRRILALVPWVAEQDGPTVEEVCERFGYNETALVEDLELLFLCGLYPFTPDTLIEADIADGRVWIRFAEFFARPLRLTPAEALALLTVGSAMLSAPGSDPNSPLARGLAKLAAVMGVDLDEAVEVEFAPVSSDILSQIGDAVTNHSQVEIDYYSYGRDEWTKRVIDPTRLFNSAGQWYVAAYCHRVEDGRLFRLDRIRNASVLPSHFEPPKESKRASEESALFSPRPDDPEVVLELEPSGRWATEYYPSEQIIELGEGRQRARFRVSEQGWLERLLLRLGPDARVIEGDSNIGSSAAEKVLARYR